MSWPGSENWPARFVSRDLRKASCSRSLTTSIIIDRNTMERQQAYWLSSIGIGSHYDPRTSNSQDVRFGSEAHVSRCRLQGPLAGGERVSASGATKTLLLCVFAGGGLAAALGAKPENGPADCGRSMF